MTKVPLTCDRAATRMVGDERGDRDVKELVARCSLRRTWRAMAWIGLGLFVMGPRPIQGADVRPNILVILADDLGYADLGFTGAKDIPTPHLDRLAREGIQCTNGYVSNPFCSPTRAGLLTGRYQQRFGHEHNPPFDPASDSIGLPADQITLAQMLKAAGYVTGVVGKWHLGAGKPFYPNERGFDEFYGFTGGGHRYFCDELAAKRDELEKRREAGMPVSPESFSYVTPLERNGRAEQPRGYLTDVFGGEAADFVRRHGREGKPWFLYLAFNAPHTPHQAPDVKLEQLVAIADRRRRCYAAMVSAMDDAVGEVLAALRQLQLEERTLVFFLNDNGAPAGAFGKAANNLPLRGGKRQTYEGGVRVPFVVSWPGRLPPGVYQQPVVCFDIFATAAAAAGAQMPQDRPMDGVNLIPYLTGTASGAPHDRLFWRCDEQIGVRMGPWKLCRSAQGKSELYDLNSDVTESRNVAAEHPDRVKAMLAAYDDWCKGHVPPKFFDPK